MFFRQIFDPRLAQYAYLIGCQRTGEVVVIDPLRDVDRYVDLARREGLRLVAVAETHIHADFLSGARELAHRIGARVYVSGEGGADWQTEWLDEEGVDGHRLRDGESFQIGKIELRAVHTPGHTPEHMAYLVTDHGGGAAEPMGLVSGDFVFVGDLGRPDLLESAAGHVGAQEPSARQLYRSARDFLNLPEHLQVWPGHGAGSACGKALGAVPTSTVGYERRYNASLRALEGGEEAFVAAILEGQPEPPLYFARMKKLNREGPPRLLDSLPRPRRLDPSELAQLAKDDAIVLDTRADRRAFMAAHLEGSLYTPLDRSFPTVAGSYVEPGTPIYLLIEPSRLEEAVRELIRIGLDDVVGWAAPEDLATGGVATVGIEAIDFQAVERLRGPGRVAVDVRGFSELTSGMVDDAIHIAHTRLAARVDELPKDRELLVYCRTGGRAAVASALLAQRGFKVRWVDDDVIDFLAHQR